jgi:NDP-sugar pyrophosphorylase family protein
VRAVLLAAGRGTRLAEAVGGLPKILAPLAGRPLLKYQLDYLYRHGVTELAINTHHQADEVEAAVSASETPIAVHISRESELLGTAGALVPLRSFLSEPFVVLYGDVLTDVDLRELHQIHCQSEAVATLVVHQRHDVTAKGVCAVDASGRITDFIEKAARPGPGTVNAGVHVLDPSVHEHIARGFSDFGHDIWPRLIALGLVLCAYRWDGYVRDIGTPSSLVEAEHDLCSGVLAW